MTTDTQTWYKCTCDRINYRRKYWLFGKLTYDEVRDPRCPVHVTYKAAIEEPKQGKDS